MPLGRPHLWYHFGPDGDLFRGSWFEPNETVFNEILSLPLVDRGCVYIFSPFVPGLGGEVTARLLFLSISYLVSPVYHLSAVIASLWKAGG